MRSIKKTFLAALNVVEEYTRAIFIKFELDKCTVTHLVKGRLYGTGRSADLMHRRILKYLDAGELINISACHRTVQDSVAIK